MKSKINTKNNEKKRGKSGEKLSCCGNKNPSKKGKGFLQGFIYGLIPHIGCIMFIIGSILGVTILMQFFRPLLMNRYIFHYLILISVGFATLSSFLYLRKNKSLSLDGIKRKKSYLSIMYGSTIGVNLLLFFLLFPLLANFSLAGETSFDGNPEDLRNIKLSVNIPCPGHAPLISNELKTIDGVFDVKFGFPNNFDVKYDSTITNLEVILGLEVFNEYTAKVIGSFNYPELLEESFEEASFNQDPIGSEIKDSGSCCACGGCK